MKTTFIQILPVIFILGLALGCAPAHPPDQIQLFNTPAPATLVAVPQVTLALPPPTGASTLPALTPATLPPDPTSAALPTITPLSVPTLSAAGRTATAETLAAQTSATNVPAPTAVLGENIFVTGLRMNPSPAKNAQPPTFFATFLNTTGESRSVNWCVEIWRPDETKKSFGVTTCRPRTLPPGTSEASSSDWKVSGIGACTPFRARAIGLDQDQARTPFTQPNGSPLWLDFQVCP